MKRPKQSVRRSKRDNGEEELEGASLFDLDKHALDKHWLEQPRMMHTNTMKAAIARRDLAEAEANVKVVEADLNRRIRKDFEKYGLEKVTVEGVKQAVRDHERYQSAVSAVTEAVYRADVYGAMVASLIDRKKTLEKLQELFLNDYYGEPRTAERSTRHRRVRGMERDDD